MGMMVAAQQHARAAEERMSRVHANQTETWRVWLPKGEHRILVHGDHHTDLDLYVYDNTGHLIVFDVGHFDDCVSTLSTARSGYLELRVRNLGQADNVYELSVE
jgi:hypothetical protein